MKVMLDDTAELIEKRSLTMFKEFKTFALKGNVIDLAVAVIIGAAFGKIVESMVKDVITPMIGIFGGQPDFSAIKLGPIMVGNFVNAIVSFLILALVVFLVLVKPMTALRARAAAGQAPSDPTTKDCSFCFTPIPIKATRCPHCTSELAL